MIEIVPAVIPADFADIEKGMSTVAGFVKRVQIDVSDGAYTPVRTWPYTAGDDISTELKRVPWQKLKYEFDLMVERPEESLETWFSSGAVAIIVHLRSTQEMPEIIRRARERKVGIGIALRPNDNNEAIAGYAEDITFVQCMGNEKIGYHGVALDERVYDKIADLRLRYPALTITVDIGVNTDTAPKLIAAGASRLVSGSAIFGSNDPREAYETLVRAAHQ